MESSDPKRRFPPPWRIERTQHGYRVKDANDLDLASVYCRDDLHENRWDDYKKHLTSDEARRIAKGIARLPELLNPHPGFGPRGCGHKWSPLRPYHVAIEDAYMRENWDDIDALCKFNCVPFDRTGERINKWIVCEFASQFDALMFWKEFRGRWLLGSDFFFPSPEPEVPKMKRPKHWEKMVRQPRRD
jgi:hypothetical protein